MLAPNYRYSVNICLSIVKFFRIFNTIFPQFFSAAGNAEKALPSCGRAFLKGPLTPSPVVHILSTEAYRRT